MASISARASGSEPSGSTNRAGRRLSLRIGRRPKTARVTGNCSTRKPASWPGSIG